jgi:hypothetical protein
MTTDIGFLVLRIFSVPGAEATSSTVDEDSHKGLFNLPCHYKHMVRA